MVPNEMPGSASGSSMATTSPENTTGLITWMGKSGKRNESATSSQMTGKRIASLSGSVKGWAIDRKSCGKDQLPTSIMLFFL